MEQRFRLRGDIDLVSRNALVRNLDILIECSGDDVVIDCTDVTFMDSTGINALVAAEQRLNLQGRELRVVAVPRTTRRVLELLGLTGFLHVEEDIVALSD